MPFDEIIVAGLDLAIEIQRQCITANFTLTEIGAGRCTKEASATGESVDRRFSYLFCLLSEMKPPATTYGCAASP